MTTTTIARQKKKHPAFTTRPIFLQVRDDMVNRIGDGEWELGAQLPSEPDLARDYGVSPGTMRKALDAMEAELLVRRQQGRGTYVTRQRPVSVCPTCKRAMG